MELAAGAGQPALGRLPVLGGTRRPNAWLGDTKAAEGIFPLAFGWSGRRETVQSVSRLAWGAANGDVHYIPRGRVGKIALRVTSRIHRSQPFVQVMRHSWRPGTVPTDNNRACANEYEE